MFRFIWWTHTSCEHVHISIDLKIYCFISCSVKEQRTNCALDSSQLWFLKDYFSKYLVHLKPHILYFPVDAALFEWTCDFFSIVLALCCCDTCESGIGHWTIFFVQNVPQSNILTCQGQKLHLRIFIGEEIWTLNS